MALRRWACVVVLSSCASFKPVVVVAAGDISLAEPSEGARETAELVESLHPDAVLALGDLQYDDGALERFERVYGPTWGRFKDKTYPAPGNHEYKTPGASGYFTYFGARAGDPAKG